MTRRLSLARETLTELAAADLSAVHGGAVTTNCPTLPVHVCLTYFTCNAICHWSG